MFDMEIELNGGKLGMIFLNTLISLPVFEN